MTQPIEGDRPVNHEKIESVGRAIEEFFKGRNKNIKRVEWFSPKNTHIPPILRDISNSIGTFFSDKKWYNGGSIPDELLYTKTNFRLINRITIADAIKLAYDSINVGKTLVKTGYSQNGEMYLTLRILQDCGKKHIPQDYIGGLLLLYLELCEKVVLL